MAAEAEPHIRRPIICTRPAFNRVLSFYTIMNKRKQISTRQRFEVFKRDGFICQYCGSNPPNVILHVDHIIPVSKGGENIMDNYITSCSKCNLGKSNVSLKNIPKTLKEKSEEIAEKEAQIKGYYEIIEAKRLRLENQAWIIAQILDKNASDGFYKNWFKSIEIFIDKLGYHEVLEAMERATIKIHNQNQAFKYFCGICWNKLKNN